MAQEWWQRLEPQPGSGGRLPAMWLSTGVLGEGHRHLTERLVLLADSLNGEWK